DHSATPPGSVEVSRVDSWSRVAARLLPRRGCRVRWESTMAGSPRPARSRLLADVGPLRESPAFRRLYFGQLVSFLGSEFTRVAIPYQIFVLTHSSLQVG